MKRLRDLESILQCQINATHVREPQYMVLSSKEYGSLDLRCLIRVDQALFEVQINRSGGMKPFFYKFPEEIESIVSRAYEETLTASGMGEKHLRL